MYLKGTELGNSVDQVESLIKKHEAFESLLSKQDQKVGMGSYVDERLETLR